MSADVRVVAAAFSEVLAGRPLRLIRGASAKKHPEKPVLMSPRSRSHRKRMSREADQWHLGPWKRLFWKPPYKYHKYLRYHKVPYLVHAYVDIVPPRESLPSGSG